MVCSTNVIVLDERLVEDHEEFFIIDCFSDLILKAGAILHADNPVLDLV